MPSPNRRKATGYIVFQEINRATRANADARQMLERMLSTPAANSAAFSAAAARLSLALGTNLDALSEINRIITNLRQQETTSHEK